MDEKPNVIIVDYGLGNIFSIARTIRYVGASVEVTDEANKILEAERVILPGVGAFGDGMKSLDQKGLVQPLREYVQTKKPLLGICLGMQLFLTEGEEFGRHRGLDFIKGIVTRLKLSNPKEIKIPHVGWNKILYPRSNDTFYKGLTWKETILENIAEESFFYFVHSNIVIPDDYKECIAETSYAGNTFCSVLRKGNIYGCQFHPEMSGEKGLKIYRKFIFGNDTFLKDNSVGGGRYEEKNS